LAIYYRDCCVFLQFDQWVSHREGVQLHCNNFKNPLEPGVIDGFSMTIFGDSEG
jgi:hypothetical protein